jgi:uncharacterized protein YyaL (SSP411 family)
LGLTIILFILRGIPMASELKSKEEKKIHQSNESSSDREIKHNRLIFEKSPYLLQHAENPVDWYPWSEEAFLKAEKEDKPVFLSIGYSACHWCQVMERESFEDEEVAKLMNKYFVSVKVDREERPDIDNIYMTVCQFMTGSGGWPLTIIMTPDKEPFFAGTYFPKEAKYGRPGLMEILEQIASLWRKDRPRVLQAGNQVRQTIQNFSSSRADGDLTEENLKQAYQEFKDSFDETRGGFGRAPKFPSAHNLSLLLRWWKRSGEDKALMMVEKTLDAMWRGGMYDHLGFGFHRYSTDSKWLVPHFEKMLYDQAMLAIAYVEAYQATGKEQYAEVARQIFNYVLRDMTSPEGVFYSSENADSEGEEGKFYIWTQEEIKAIIGEEHGDLFCRFYGITEKGNLEEGRSVLHIRSPVEEFARDEGMAPDELNKILEQSRKRLFAAREKRIHPSKDDKILTDWNGLMIAALSKGAQALNKPEYADAARKAADFLLQGLRSKDDRLLHRYREGEAALPGYVDDYAFLAWGLIDLYEATFEARYLQEALALTDDMLRLFWDDKDGGLYFTGVDNEKLIARMKDAYDGAIPSGNSVAALNLLRFGRITMRQELEEKAEQAMEIFGKTISSSPTAFSQLLIALDFALGPTKEIVIAGDLRQEGTSLMLHAIRRRFLPGKVLILHPEGEEGKAIEKIIPFVKDQNKISGKAAAYICENYTCKLPTTDVQKMISYILQ